MPASDSPFGSVLAVWSQRHYRTKGVPRTCEWEGERGVALPLRPPPWWYLPLFGLLTVGVGAFAVVGVVRLVRGEAVTGAVATVVGAVMLLLFTGLFALATWATYTRRRDPGEMVVTPTRLVAERVHAPWRGIDAVFAHQEHRQGHLRAIDIASVHVEGHTLTVYEAGHLDVDPRTALEALRRLHRDPALRARLATDDGPGIFTEESGQGSRS